MTTDITGTSIAIVNGTVVAIQGNAVKSQSLGSNQDGYVLTWVDGNDDWEATALPGSLPPDGAAGGDLSGSYPNPVVAALQTNSVNDEALGSAQDGYVLTWDGADGYWKAASTVKVVCGAYSASTQSVSAGSTVKITNWTIKFDNTSSFDVSNSNFIAPTTAYYSVSAQLILSGTLSTDAGVWLSAFVNGSDTDDNGLSLVGSAGQVQVALNTIVYIEAGQTLDLRVSVGGTNGLTVIAYTSDNYINIHQI